jgi:undecaprenyl diphosphate synthase
MINHLWIVMDWNRRWAKARFLPAVAWHKSWADNVKKITEICFQKWINYLTLWGLSVDNLYKREEEEVNWIIKLINNIEAYLWDALKNNLRFDTIWDIEKLPLETQNVLQNMVEKTKNNNWITLTIALIYWWQDEVVRATKKILEAWIKPENLTREEFRKYLDTAKLPVVDMIVRTGWDARHSGFLLYDSEYSEYFFSKKMWPELDESEIDKIISAFDNSKRNFGK